MLVIRKKRRTLLIFTISLVLVFVVMLLFYRSSVKKQLIQLCEDFRNNPLYTSVSYDMYSSVEDISEETRGERLRLLEESYSNIFTSPAYENQIENAQEYLEESFDKRYCLISFNWNITEVVDYSLRSLNTAYIIVNIQRQGVEIVDGDRIGYAGDVVYRFYCIKTDKGWRISEIQQTM